MGTKIPLPNIPDSNTAPEDIYRLEVTGIEESVTKPETGSKLMMIVDCAIVEPTEYSDVTIREWMTIGSDKDPNAVDPGGDAWRSIGARAFKSFLIACGYPLAELDMDDVVQQLPGCQFTAKVNLSPAKGDFPERNRLAKFFPPGTQEVKAASPRPQQQPHRAPAAAPVGRSAAAPAAAARPGPSAAPAARPGPARPAPRQTAVVPAEAAPEEVVAETRATPAATPTQRARRSPAKARAGVGAVEKAAAGLSARMRAATTPAVLTQECAICEVIVPRAEFQAHVKAHGDA